MSSKQANQTITPIADNVLLKEIESKQESAFGIILPESSNEQTKLKQAIVVAVGEGSYKGETLVPLSLKKGDTVLFTWGENFSFEGEDFILTKESQVVAVISKKTKK